MVLLLPFLVVCVCDGNPDNLAHVPTAATTNNPNNLNPVFN